MWTLWCVAREKEIIGLGLTGDYSYRTGESFYPLHTVCVVWG